MTKQEVRAAQNYFIAEANKYEYARDNAVHESAIYWKMHDKAINLLTAAESLMPGQGWDYCESAWR
jgi:hypothetical protein